MSEDDARRRWQAVSARLDELLALDSPAARATHLARLREEDPALAAELGELVAASEAPDELLDAEHAALAALLSSPPAAPAPPAWIGPWRVTGVLGAGGMGAVFAAERQGEGFVQRAAVKVLSAGAPRGPLHQRFLAERGILARLEHPGIARMLDAGVAADGTPYLAMELVEGATLTEACRARRAKVEERLALFLEVCAAVEHAHRNLVVHRDLKPSNVMVDRDGRVKLLDFGIAKLLEPEASAAAAPTLLRAMTPQYAAPEQAAGGAMTPATDVYAMGALLHELLAGVPPREAGGERPFTVERALAGASAAPLARSARADASRPEGDRLARRLEGDLERIVERAMAREPGRRYHSAGELAADLRRHLEGRPVAARGAAVTYRAGRFLSRHRSASFAATLALAVLLLAGLLLASRARRDAAPSRTAMAPVLAILPFAALGEVEPFRAVALTEEVATALGRARGLAVLSSGSVAAGAGGAPAGEHLRRELGATHLLRGSVEAEAARLRVRVALDDLAAGTVLWADRFDWQAASPLDADTALAERVAQQVLARLATGAGAPAQASPATRDPRAYEAFQRGVAELAGRTPAGAGAEQRLAATVQLELAVALDPGYAPAWARLGTVYAQRLFRDAPSADLERRATVAIQRALALDPGLAEAYLARAQLAWRLANGFPHARAVADLRRALELQPSLAEAHRELCKIYLHVGLTDRAVAACDRAIALDPADRTALVRKLTALADDGRFAAVAEALESKRPEISTSSRAGLLLEIGETNRALALLRPATAGRRPSDPEFGWPTSARAALERAWSALALAQLGRVADARELLARAEFSAESLEEQSHLHHAYYAVGAAHARLGNRDEALAWLEKAADEGYPSYPLFSRDSDLATLAGDLRFRTLLGRLEADWRRWRDEL